MTKIIGEMTINIIICGVFLALGSIIPSGGLNWMFICGIMAGGCMSFVDSLRDKE